jgi:two-component system sensor histidine kinase/response regulator
MKTALNRQWIRLTGDPATYSMENRAFNLVSFISLLAMAYMFLFDVFIDQWQMCIVMACLSIVQVFLYYQSLVKRNYRRQILIYGLLAYLGLAINYHYNSGVGGPTMFVFFLIFQLVLTIAPSRYSIPWTAVNIVLALGLYTADYLSPSLFPDSYPSRGARFIDFGSTYALCIVFIYFITTYLKRYYKSEKRIAEERLVAIRQQNAIMLKQTAELERLDAEKNKMFSIISHDLRAPIDSIKGYLEILSRSLVSQEEKEEIEIELLSQVRYTSELLQNMLQWSKTQMQGLQQNLVPLNLKDIIDEMGSSRLSGASAKGVKLTYSIDKELEVIADADMLKVVMRNLLGNAVKFTPAGGEVVIKALKEGDSVTVFVKDNGIGISRAKQDQLFTLHSATTFGTDNEKGVGLGLLLCKDFMERQGGSLWFHSTEGQGSTFFIKIPSAQL